MDSYLRDLMLQAASEDGNVQEMLMDAVEQKGTFESDDKALNNTIGKVSFSFSHYVSAWDTCNVPSTVPGLRQYCLTSHVS